MEINVEVKKQYGYKSLAVVINAVKCYVTWKHVGFNWAEVTIQIPHRVGQMVKVRSKHALHKAHGRRSTCVSTFVNTPKYSNSVEMMADVISWIEDISLVIDHTASEDRVNYEILAALGI